MRVANPDKMLFGFHPTLRPEELSDVIAKHDRHLGLRLFQPALRPEERSDEERVDVVGTRVAVFQSTLRPEERSDLVP
ncbi:hypothetical protein [Corallococcus sp. AB038B]|uniref:hypothetical protein n=1 Tax=Corallococcus sp. AB038B TaxID=2316718 RepID=UPI0011C45CB2|nr:hypothetical protein [Corallococcus sp. AB038B]